MSTVLIALAVSVLAADAGLDIAILKVEGGSDGDHRAGAESGGYGDGVLNSEKDIGGRI